MGKAKEVFLDLQLLQRLLFLRAFGTVSIFHNQ